MSTWHKKVTQSLADSVSAILSDMKEDQKGSQNGMLKKGKGEPAGQIKPKQDIPEEDDDTEGKKLDPVDKTAVKKKFKNRKDQDLDNDGDTDSSDKFLHKKRKAITKAIRNTSEGGKKIKLSGKKEKVSVSPNDISAGYTFSDERAVLREDLEASFDTVFKYSNKEEEAYRDQWMGQFDTLVSSKEPNAYLDPLQRRVLYIEGITPEQAASRYLSHCVSNSSLSGGSYQKTGTTGGDPNMSSKQQGQPVGDVVRSARQVKTR